MIQVQRKELKYTIGPVECLQLKKLLKYTLENDSHNGTDGYCVRSLYFDSWNDFDFESKVDGYDDRKKIRIRIYGQNDSIIKLELKEKVSDSQQKTSLALTKDEALQMMAGNYDFLLQRSESSAQCIALTMMTQCYRPKCIVEYDRYAYMSDVNDIRVTFDANIRASESNLDLFDPDILLYPVTYVSEITMEVKYNQFLLSNVKNAISKVDKLNISNSKYCRARMISKKGRF